MKKKKRKRPIVNSYRAPVVFFLFQNNLSKQFSDGWRWVLIHEHRSSSRQSDILIRFAFPSSFLFPRKAFRFVGADELHNDIFRIASGNRHPAADFYIGVFKRLAHSLTEITIAMSLLFCVKIPFSSTLRLWEYHPPCMSLYLRFTNTLAEALTRGLKLPSFLHFVEHLVQKLHSWTNIFEVSVPVVFFRTPFYFLKFGLFTLHTTVPFPLSFTRSLIGAAHEETAAKKNSR